MCEVTNSFTSWKKMYLKKESNSVFSSVLVSCIYLSICFFMQYGITDFICTFFSVHVLFLKLYAQFFFFLQFTQQGPNWVLTHVFLLFYYHYSFLSGQFTWSLRWVHFMLSSVWHWDFVNSYIWFCTWKECKYVGLARFTAARLSFSKIRDLQH